MKVSSDMVVALGAIIAALVTGAVSFVNMLISKELKISEFRQEWIDKLREEVSLLCSKALYLSAMMNYNITKHPDFLDSEKFQRFVTEITPHALEIEQMDFLIKLR